jgi:hypothetical protein
VAQFIDVVRSKQKALLIRIGYAGHKTSAPLTGVHDDMNWMRTLLIERYGYLESDIVSLLDTGEGIQPMRANIVRFPTFISSPDGTVKAGLFAAARNGRNPHSLC